VSTCAAGRIEQRAMARLGLQTTRAADHDLDRIAAEAGLVALRDALASHRGEAVTGACRRWFTSDRRSSA
jgi:hypothetical protein